jgi:hypothetical protein
MRTRILFFLGLFAGAFAAQAEVLECNAEMKAKVLAPAKPESNSVVLDCNLRLNSADVVTKQLLFVGSESSGVTLDCNGATLKAAAGLEAVTRIKVTSRAPANPSAEDKWTPAENILIKQCRIEGAVWLRGMAGNGEDPSLTASSRRPGHSERVRANAPRRIVFSNNHFIGTGAIPIYFAPGVHDSMILDSQIGGLSRSVAIYLDAESGDNTIKGNQINTETTLPQTTTHKVRNLFYGLFNQLKGASNAPSLTGRELIAVDASRATKSSITGSPTSTTAASFSTATVARPATSGTRRHMATKLQATCSITTSSTAGRRQSGWGHAMAIALIAILTAAIR